MLEIKLIPFVEFQRIRKASIDKYDKLSLLADMCRLNAFSSVKLAGSGHLGSSFSAMDILVLLYFYEMNILEVGIDNPHRDIFFSSKGHDCPGQYSVLAATGILPFEKLLKLRRLGGLDGHPDVKIPGIEANSGSLGMGISKARGMSLAKKISGYGGRVFVMTGDGEIQEGQIWEAIQTTIHQRITNIHVIVDFNKIQTDKEVKEIIDLGDLQKKFEIFGWHVERCDGHNFAEIDYVFKKFKTIADKPKVLIADTIKGKGISFMEGPTALKNESGIYKWHSGSPDDDSFESGHLELVERINMTLDKLGFEPLLLEVVETREIHKARFKDSAEKVVNAYGEALVELGEKRKDIVVFDADLSADCGLRSFELRFPDRFIENGIAEQDMVSMAGGLALQGLLPIVNSFGAFLASRANEQIYNNATENTKIIYVCHYSGLIPAGPGKSHQSIRDISLLGALPNCVSIEPCNGAETKLALNWCVNEAKENCLLRLAISPSPRNIVLPEGYEFTFGRGTLLRDGTDAVIFTYSPVMLHEALIAADLLQDKNISLKVVNIPWLNRIDMEWFEKTVGNCKYIFTLDNHFIRGGLGDFLLNIINESQVLQKREFVKFGLLNYPECGTPAEVFDYHQLSGGHLSSKISEIII